MRLSLSAVVCALAPLCFRIQPATAAALESRGDAPQSTTFNGKLVPPLRQLSGNLYATQISSGYWFVKAFSPWCPHCTSLAPKWQTIYEYYYTSNPLPGANDPTDTKDSLNTFTRFYDFKFAALDCDAFGTACGEIGVHSYPTMVLFKNGEKIKELSGDVPMETLSKFIEENLEAIKPGTRPTDGIELPKVGVTEFVPTRTPSPPRTNNPALPPDDVAKPIGAIRPTNPDGVSFPFTAETFDQLQRKTMDPWFIKFYAPWCPHCQKMAPTWTEMARGMTGRLNVGEVNCDVEGKLCNDLGANSYPTILFFRGSEHVQYEGLRGLGDLVDFANQAIEASTVRTVDAKEFGKLEDEEEVIFIYFYDHATTSEDFLALERLPLHLIGKGKIVKTADKALADRFKVVTFPRLIVSKDGRSTAYDKSTPSEMRDVAKIRTWMQSVWTPWVPEVSAFNAQYLMSGKLMVLGILSRDRRQQFSVSKRELKNAALEWMDREERATKVQRAGMRDAKQFLIEEAREKGDKEALEKAQQTRIDMDSIKKTEVAFAWIDGVFWERWTKHTFGLSVKRDGEKVVIHDELHRRYWDVTAAGTPIIPRKESILETITQVYADRDSVPWKPTDPRIIRTILRIGSFIFAHPFLTFFGVAGTILIAATTSTRIGRRSRRRSFGSVPFHKLEDRGGAGSIANGKVD